VDSYQITLQEALNGTQSNVRDQLLEQTSWLETHSRNAYTSLQLKFKDITWMQMVETALMLLLFTQVTTPFSWLHHTTLLKLNKDQKTWSET